MHRLVLASVFAMVATGAAAGDQFDFVCKGTMIGGRKTQPWNERIAVDLAVGTYCSEPCETPRPILRSDPQRIVFVDRDEAVSGGRSQALFAVSRTDGRVERYFRVASGAFLISKTWRGVCEVANYTAPVGAGR